MAHFLEHGATSWRGQQLQHGGKGVDRFDPRARIIAATLFAGAAVFSHNLIVPALALFLSVAVALCANLNLQRTLRRVAAVDTFIIFMLLMLPFSTPGEPMFELFGFAASFEGLYKAVEIGLKTNAVVLMLLALVGTMEATTLGYALARLRVPEKLVHLMLFTVRYLEVIGREYGRMRKAMRARAFQPRNSRHTYRSVGYLVGMMLIRSLDRSERALAAMKCRGFRGQLFLLDHLQWQPRDALPVAAALGFVLFAIAVGLGA